MLRGSDRAGASVADLRDAMPLRDWLRVAVPPSLAGNAFDPHLGQHFIPIVYVGVVTCALAIVGAIFAWRRIGGRVALLIASIVFAHLPLPLVRYPARLVPFGALAIVAIAVEGWDVVARVVRFRWIAVLVALAIFAEVIASARVAKIVRVGDPALVALNRRAWIGGYLNLYERRFDTWTAAPLVARNYEQLYERAVRDPSMRLLDAMSAGYVLAPRRRAVVGFRNRAALPLAYAGNAVPSLLAFGTTFVHAVVTLPSPSTLIVTQQRAPGWSVDVDGHRATPEGGDFLPVHLPPGTHDVLWRYRSVPLLVGALLTLVALARMLFPQSFVKRRAHENFFHGTLEMSGNCERREA